MNQLLSIDLLEISIVIDWNVVPAVKWIYNSISSISIDTEICPLRVLGIVKYIP